VTDAEALLLSEPLSDASELSDDEFDAVPAEDVLPGFPL
jgi:hypothetical protein